MNWLTSYNKLFFGQRWIKMFNLVKMRKLIYFSLQVIFVSRMLLSVKPKLILSASYFFSLLILHCVAFSLLIGLFPLYLFNSSTAQDDLSKYSTSFHILFFSFKKTRKSNTYISDFLTLFIQRTKLLESKFPYKSVKMRTFSRFFILYLSLRHLNISDPN